MPPALVNVVTIAALLIAPHLGWTGEVTTAPGAGLGSAYRGVAQCGWYPALRRAGLRLRLKRPVLTPAGGVSPPGPAGVVAAGITQITAFVGLVIASPEPGAVAWLYMPIASINCRSASPPWRSARPVPDIARPRAVGDRAARRRPWQGGGFARFLSLPAALALMVAGAAIVTVLFERGVFGPRHRGDGRGAAAFAAGLPASPRQAAAAAVLRPHADAAALRSSPSPAPAPTRAVDRPCSPSGTSRHCAACGVGLLNAVLLALAARRRGWLQLDATARRRLAAHLAGQPVMVAALVGLAGLVALGQARTPRSWLRLATLRLITGGGFRGVRRSLPRPWRRRRVRCWRR